MSQLSKQALKVENQTSFPNNNTNYITPAILRDYNVDIIDSMVDEIPYGAYTQSVDTSIDALNAFTASASGLTTGSLLVTASAAGNTITFTKGDASTFNVTVATGSIADVSALNQATASLQAYTASANVKFQNLESTTASLNTSVTNINTFTASTAVSITNINSVTASQQTSINNLNSTTASLFTSASLTLVTASINNDDITFTKGDGTQFTIQVATGSFALSASYAETSSITRNVVVTARNGNASTLGAGTVVHITSAVGDNPIFTTASYDTEALSSNTFGLLRYSSAAGADVEVVVSGVVTGVNTDPALGFAAGDVLYLSSSGQFTNIQPQAPNQIVTIGQVLRAQQNNGSIYVSINNGWELNELHNVQITNPLTGDLLQYESSSYGLWKNKSISGAGITTTASFNAYTASTDSDLASIHQTTASLNSTTASLLTSASLAVVTASINNSTNTITFTKGNGTTFDILVQTGSVSPINTGSFATTGSNSFTGTQTLGLGAIVPNGQDVVFEMLTGSIAMRNNVGLNRLLFLDPISNQKYLYIDKDTAEVHVSGAFTAPLQNGYAWVGDSTGINSQVPTSSFAGTSINTGSFATTGSNVFTGNQTIYKPEGKLIFQSGSSNTAEVGMTAAGDLQLAVQSTQIGLLGQNAITLQKNTTINGNVIANKISCFNFDSLFYGSQLGGTTTNGTFFGYGSNSYEFVVGAYSGPNDNELKITTDSTGITFGDFNGSSYPSFLKLLPNSGTNPKPIMTRGLEVTGSTEVGTFTSSLANGYTYVGGANGRTTTVATSSFGTSINTGSFATTGSNVFNGDQTISGSLYISGAVNLFSDGANGFAYSGKALFLTNSVQTGITVESPIHFYQAGKGDMYIQNNVSGVGSGSMNIIAANGANLNVSASTLALTGRQTINAAGGNGLDIIGSGLKVAGTIVGNNNIQALGANANMYLMANSNYSGSQYPGQTIIVAPNVYPTDIYGGLTIATEQGYAAGATFLGVVANSYSPQYGGTTVPMIIANGNNPAGNDTAIIWTSDGSAEHYKKSRFKYGIDVTGSTEVGTFTASLANGYVWVGDSTGKTTTVATSSFGGGGAAFPYAGTASISGSLQVTGSLSTLPITLSVVASTASIDMTAGNTFILNIPTGSTTHIVPTNIIAGQTINLLVKQAAGATTGSLAWSPLVLFPSGLDMQATATGSAQDLISMISFDTTNLMAANVKNLK